MGIKKKFIRITLWLGSGSKFKVEGNAIAGALIDTINQLPFEVRQEIGSKLGVSVDSWSSSKCLACGESHGSGNLPCPKFTVT